MKKLFFLCSVIVYSITSFAQQLNLQWANQMGDFSNHPEFITYARSVATDTQGNVYETGKFGGSVKFGNLMLNSNGIGKMYITKADASGNFIWAKDIGEYGMNVPGVYPSITTDINNNVYVIGTFNGTIDFDPGNGIFNLTKKSNFDDIFILKLNTNGDFIWAKSFGSADDTWLNKMNIAVDKDQNVYAAGHLDGTGDFDPGNGTFNLSSVGGEDIFVLKLDKDGNFVWAKAMGGLDDEAALSIAIDKKGNVYTTGKFQQIADFDPAGGFINAFLMKPIGITDTYISKLDKNGNFVWAKQLGGKNGGKILGQAITVDEDDNILSTGYYWNTIDFDPGDGEFFLGTSNNQTPETYILKLNAEGEFIWMKEIKAEARSTAIVTDAVGSVYTTGFFWNSTDFMPGRPVFKLTSKGEADIFVQKLDAKGNFVWAKAMGGADSDASFAIALDKQANIFLAGEFNSTADFDPEDGVFNLNGPKTFAFLAKYKQPLPEIMVTQNNAIIPSGGAKDFGTVKIFTNKDLIFTIFNTGTDNLVFNDIDVTGDFTLTGILPMNIIQPGFSTSITVRMKSSNIVGLKNGKLTIKNNDVDEKNYTISLFGKVDDKFETPVNANYSNPAINEWEVNLKNNKGSYTYTLTNAEGITFLTKTQSLSNFKIPAQNLHSGVYYLHLDGENIHQVITLLKK